MSSSQQVSQPTPERIFELINAYQNSAALKAATELDLFTAIGEGNQEPASLARRCKTSERGIRILCDFLVVAGLLTKSGSRYGLAPDAALFLDRRSPASMASLPVFLLSPLMTSAFLELTAAVKKGGTMISDEGTLAPENPVWVDFARNMAPLMAFPAELTAGLLGASEGKMWKVLDIAAGHGLFGITLARHNPNAQIVALDWPNVLEVAKENAAAAGVAGRYRVMPGSAFDVEYGAGYDVVLLTNFLHHFDVPTCETLLRKVHAALAPGGRAVALEFVPNEDRVSPPVAAKFSMMMLGTTPSGDAYTHSQYQSMFRNAGFKSCALHSLPIPEQIVVAEK
ncbi:MAG TPA: class I SAM-dependent methyltransferase [Candidatus Limnocylindrales bacterium]|nr:class I SAM-dependent methyltransferase [Candidatus Limnocylindrales bacterium]